MVKGPNKLKIVQLNGNIQLGPFDIEFVTLTHSILEPNGLSINTPSGTVLHTGDWKIDPNPLIGNKINEANQDVNNLNLTLDVNGNRHQTGNTNQMIFNFNFLIAHITSFITLMPGDIVTTGTPPGVGLGMNPPVFLKDGDKMELSIDGLGKQNLKVTAE